MNKKGFTLVELMVVIVIIGVLAAVAIPKMMAATNKAKAGEGPQILRSIASMEATFKAENDSYIEAVSEEKGAATAGNGWYELGFDQNPFSRYFDFDVTGAPYQESGEYSSVAVTTFIATAALKGDLGDAKKGEALTVDETDTRTGQETKLGKLVPNWK